VRKGSNLLTRSWQVKDDRKHGRNRSAAEWRPRLPCRIGKDACDQLSFQKVTLLIFSMLIYIAVSTTLSSSALEAWGITQQICEFKDWEAVFLR